MGQGSGTNGQCRRGETILLQVEIQDKFGDLDLVGNKVLVLKLHKATCMYLGNLEEFVV